MGKCSSEVNAPRRLQRIYDVRIGVNVMCSLHGALVGYGGGHGYATPPILLPTLVVGRKA